MEPRHSWLERGWARAGRLGRLSAAVSFPTHPCQPRPPPRPLPEVAQHTHHSACVLGTSSRPLWKSQENILSLQTQTSLEYSYVSKDGNHFTSRAPGHLDIVSALLNHLSTLCVFLRGQGFPRHRARGRCQLVLLFRNNKMCFTAAQGEKLGMERCRK